MSREEAIEFLNEIKNFFMSGSRNKIDMVIELLESAKVDKSEDEFNKWWNSGYKHYSTFGGNEKTIACFAWNCQQKEIDRLEAKLKEKEKVIESPLCQICGKPRKVIGFLHEVHFDCKPEGGD